MIKYFEGNIFESEAQTIVNPVNTIGVMGAGIAKEFKELFPQMFHQYKHLCELGKLTVGRLHLYKTPHKWVLNFPTKSRWQDPSKIEYIEQGLATLERNTQKFSIDSIAFPCIGCGLGGLTWTDIRKRIEKRLKKINADVYLYEDQPTQITPLTTEMVRLIKSSMNNGKFESVILR